MRFNPEEHDIFSGAVVLQVLLDVFRDHGEPCFVKPRAVNTGDVVFDRGKDSSEGLNILNANFKTS